jgi:hypothetical protein
VTNDLRRYRAGEPIEDHCRACKADRMHTIVVTDADARPLRVSCGFCRSEHNYRGGGRVPAAPASPAPKPSGHAAAAPARKPALPIVSEREIVMPAHSDLELMLRRVIREETGITSVTPADKWRGGSFVLRPGTPGVQEKSWPIETFFHKVVMLRNRLRTLEQHINAADLPEDAKVKLQTYITGCYGSLTSFNVLFAEEDDQFSGSGGD